jgi:hypothetical protein
MSATSRLSQPGSTTHEGDRDGHRPMCRTISADEDRQNSLSDIVFEADLGNTRPLYDYLLSGDPLSAKDRQLLAWLVARRMPRRSGPPSDVDTVTIARHCAAYLVRQAKKHVFPRRQGNRKPTLATLKLHLARLAIAHVEAEFPAARGKIAVADIVGSRNPPRQGLLSHTPGRTVVEYVHEHMPRAFHALRNAAIDGVKSDEA